MSASAARSAESLGSSIEAVARAMLEDCRELGLELPEPDRVDALEERHAIVHTPPGHFVRSQMFSAVDRRGIFLAGDWLTGSTVEGAVRTGEAAARRVMAMLAS